MRLDTTEMTVSCEDETQQYTYSCFYLMPLLTLHVFACSWPFTVYAPFFHSFPVSPGAKKTFLGFHSLCGDNTRYTQSCLRDAPIRIRFFAQGFSVVCTAVFFSFAVSPRISPPRSFRVSLALWRSGAWSWSTTAPTRASWPSSSTSPTTTRCVHTI